MESLPVDALATLPPAPVTLKDANGKQKVFLISQPTPGDLVAVLAQMRKLAKCTVENPIQYLLKSLKGLEVPAQILDSMSRSAIALGSGGGADPTNVAVQEQYTTLPGVGWAFWYFAQKLDKALRLEDIDDYITEDNYMDVYDKLNKALRLEDIDPKPQPSTPGTTS